MKKPYSVVNQNLSLYAEDVESCWKIVRKFFVEHKLHTNGCKTFYTPDAWAARKEEFGGGSLLVVVYDGSDVKRCFNGGELSAAFKKYLAEHGYYHEEGLHWYSGIYWKQP